MMCGMFQRLRLHHEKKKKIDNDDAQVTRPMKPLTRENHDTNRVSGDWWSSRSSIISASATNKPTLYYQSNKKKHRPRPTIELTLSQTMPPSPEATNHSDISGTADIENNVADTLRSTISRRSKGGKHLRWCRITKEVEVKDASG